MANQNCFPYVNPWVSAPGAPGGCEDPLPGRGWTGLIFHPLEDYHDIHLGQGFRLGHPALDFDAPTGTPVRAVATGAVIWAGPNAWSYGNLVILDHGGGFRTLYAHLNTVSAKCGTIVVAGTPIGTVGMSGGTSFEHLHFEVRQAKDVEGVKQYWSCDPHRWFGAQPSPPVPPDDEPDPEDDGEEEEQNVNLLRNGDFEANWSEERGHRCLVFPESGVYETDIGNIFTPPGWTTWFRHIPDTWDQPEARDARKEHDPNRVHGGEKGMLLFTFGRKHDAGFLQVVDTEPGQRLRLTAWCHAWSNHIVPGHEDCFEDGKCSCGVGTAPGFWWENDVPPLNEDQWNDAKQNFLFAVGIDPMGGTDPYSDTVVWGRAAYIYNKYAQLEVEATAEMHLATVFLRSTTQWGFKHNDAYYDDIELMVVGNGEPPPPPPPDCPGMPRIDYERTLVLLPPEAGVEWAKAVADGSWDDHRYTISGSADDAGIGALTDRNVIAVNPGEWPGDLSLKQFFEMYYPGVKYAAIEAATPLELREKLSGPFDPGPPGPDPPPIPPPTSNNHIGLHQQTMSENWDGYLAEAKPRVTKVLASMHDVLGVLRVYPETKIIWRHVDNDYGDVWGPDPRTGAQNWLARFDDSLFEICNRVAQEFPHLPEPYFYVEGLNEAYNSNAPDVIHAANIDIEHIHVIEALDLPVKAAVFCAAVGNPHHLYGQYELLLPLARVAAQTGSPFGYHNYWLGNPEYGGPAHLPEYLAFRWAEMDKVFRASGVKVYWYGGESGVVGGESGYNSDGTGWVNLNANSGWRGCYNGDWQRYENDFVYVNDWLNQWNAEHDDYNWGLTVFTVGSHFTGWREFQLDEVEINKLAVALK